MILRLSVFVSPFYFRLASLEAGQRDDSEYLKWQEEIKQREAAEKLAEIERKHLVSTANEVLALAVLATCTYYVPSSLLLSFLTTITHWLTTCVSDSIYFVLQKGQLSYEEAIIARQNHINENRERVQLAKEESDVLMKQYFAQREEEQREMRRLVEATMAGHQSTKESRQKLQVMKQKIGECNIW